MESPDNMTMTLSWSGGLVAGALSTNLSWGEGRSELTKPTATGNLAAQSWEQGIKLYTATGTGTLHFEMGIPGMPDTGNDLKWYRYL
jgi:hypothetical protein